MMAFVKNFTKLNLKVARYRSSVNHLLHLVLLPGIVAANPTKHTAGTLLNTEEDAELLDTKCPIVAVPGYC